MVNFLPFTNSSSKPPAYEKWREVYRTMSVHTQGHVPTHIFEQRRPLEGSNKAILTYREENWRPITKDEFDKAIHSYVEAALNLDVKIDYGTSKVKDYESGLFLSDGIKRVTFRDWMIKRIGAYKQTDANAIVVYLPEHPDTPFIADFQNNLPDFDLIQNKTISVKPILVTYNQVQYIDAESILFNAGMYRYGIKSDNVAPYYFALNADQTWIILPSLKDKKVIYTQIPYYKNGLKLAPFSPIGTNLVIEQLEDGQIIEYYVSDYHGAAAWGDLAGGQQSDLGVCEVRYVYPRHWVIPTKCKNDWATYNPEGKHIVIKDDKTEHMCSTCGGSGFVFDASPMGSRIIDLKGELYQDGKFTTPEGFITPPVDILDHGAKRGEFYFNKMLSALCVTNQNMTNQSAESKSFDVQYKISKNTVIITGIYKDYIYGLNVIDQYLGGKGDVTITFPEDFDVLSAEDQLYRLTELRSSKAPAIILIDFTKKYMMKAFGDTVQNKKILDFLAVTDKLFPYGTEDLQTIKSVYGSDITSEDVIYNTQAYPILKEMATDNPAILEKPFNELKALVQTEIAKYFPVKNNQVV